MVAAVASRKGQLFSLYRVYALPNLPIRCSLSCLALLTHTLARFFRDPRRRSLFVSFYSLLFFFCARRCLSPSVSPSLRNALFREHHDRALHACRTARKSNELQRQLQPLLVALLLLLRRAFLVVHFILLFFSLFLLLASSSLNCALCPLVQQRLLLHFLLTQQYDANGNIHTKLDIYMML